MQAVGSREYKLMLRASKLQGDDSKLLASAGALWADLAAIIVPHALSVSGTAEIEEKRREVRFLDTPDKRLRSNDYVVRERLDLEAQERVVTLKFRHPDRYISQGRDMEPAEGFERDLKYEDAEEGYTAKMAKRAYDAFLAIQSQLGDWISEESITKTAYVYSLAE
jgi:hypothetical protein